MKINVWFNLRIQNTIAFFMDVASRLHLSPKSLKKPRLALLIQQLAIILNAVKKSFQKTILFTIFLSLTAVLVGNYLSFHVEAFPKNAKVFMQEAVISLESQKAQVDDQDSDPCIFGFCHLGHCAVLLIPSAPRIDIVGISSTTVFFSKFNRIDRSLDVPYQPPRLI